MSEIIGYAFRTTVHDTKDGKATVGVAYVLEGGKWEDYDTAYGCYRRKVNEEITLYAVPVIYARGFSLKPARGTKWRACVSHWDARTATLSRFGRDIYADVCGTAKDAMRLAEAVYSEAAQ